MVATLKGISDGANTVKYFYFTEKNFECQKGWIDNKGKEVHGLTNLRKENFENLLDGKIIEKEESGKREVNGKELTLKPEKEIIQLGRRTKEGIIHDPGQELILSAPKSFSIMHLVAKDKRLEEVHHNAIKAVARYIEKNMLYTRIQKEGKLELVRADNVACAYFTHLTARPAKGEDEAKVEKAPDPQLHSHLIFCNATKCGDGKWRSIVFDKLYDYQLHLGEIYRMELERGSREVGYKTVLKRDEKSGKWTFEIDGGETYKGLEEDMSEFSTRRKDIEELADRENRHDSQSMAFFAKVTRDEKIEYSRDELQYNWEARVKSLEVLKSLVKEAEMNNELRKDIIITDDMDIDRTNIKTKEGALEEGIDYAVRLLSEKESVWEYESLVSAAIEKLSSQHGVDEIEQAISRRIEKGNFITSYNKELNTLTTKDNLIAEKRCVKLMQKMQGADKALMSQKEINEKIRDKGLNIGQREAVVLTLNSKDRVVGIQGSAGTGKTTTLNVIKELARDKDYELIGLAPTRSASATLKNTVNIESSTIHKFTAQYDGVIAGRGTQAGKVAMREEFANKIVVVDEASLVSSNKMKDLLTLSDKLKFRIVLLGDSKQLGAVEAGKPFYYLQNYGMNTAIMQQIVRQIEGSDLLKSVYSSEAAIDKERSEVKQKIYESLDAIGKENIIDIKEIKTEELERNNKNRIVSSLSNDEKRVVVNSDDIIEHTYSSWKEHFYRGDECYVVAPSNYLREGINEEIRKHYISGEDREHNILKRKDLAVVQMEEISHYKKGDIILFNKEYKDFENKGYYQVKEVLLKEDQLKLECYNVDNKFSGSSVGNVSNKKSGEEFVISTNEFKNKKDGFIEVFEEKTINIADGERIKWTRNSSVHDYIINGESGIVRKIKGNSVIIETSSGEKKLGIEELDLKHIDHDYSHTVYSSQGKTVDYIVGIARAKEKYINLTTQRAYYVAISRARKGAKLVIDDYKGLINSLSEKSGDKTSAIDHIAPKTNVNTIDLSKQGREVYITNSGQKLISSTSNEEQVIEKIGLNDNSNAIKKNKIDSQKQNTADKIDYDKVYNDFVRDRGLVESTANEYFGDVNHKISKNNKLRFGNKGAVVVDIDKATWYDFSSGEGGSLFKLYKERLNKYDLPLQTDVQANDKIANIQKSQPIIKKENQEKVLEAKIKRVEKIFKESLPINISQKNTTKFELENNSENSNIKKVENGIVYLQEKRKIGLNSIKLSGDIRFTNQAYNSELRQNQSAVVSIARNKAGEISAAQMIFLDSKTCDKDKSLAVNKRTIGVLKNSFVELTNNRNSKTVFIAEGIETGLSVANAEPNTRVLCALGISNFKNIDKFLNKYDLDKKIIICADNDGNKSATSQVVDMAAYTLKDKGFKDVSVIKPEVQNYDFNDVLKSRGVKGIKYYTSSVLVKFPHVKYKIINGKKEIIANTKKIESYGNLFDGYKNSEVANNRWNKLVRLEGLSKTEKNILIKPEILGELKGKTILGIKTKERKEAIEKVINNLNKLPEINRLKEEIKLKEKSIKIETENYFKDKFNALKNLDTKGLNIEEIKNKLEKIVTRDLNITDNTTDYITIKKVAEKITEKIINYRNIYSKEAIGYNKREFFIEARYEIAREDKLREYLSKEMKIKNTGDQIIFERELKRLSNIDTRLAKRYNEIYLTPVDKKELLLECHKGSKEINELTSDYIKRGYKETAAHFIATETIQYREKYGRSMTQNQVDYLGKISSYVEKNYNDLIKYGFDKNEAFISYNEAEKLFYKYDRTQIEININKPAIKSIQSESKRDLEIINEQNIGISSKGVELEDEGIGI